MDLPNLQKEIEKRAEDKLDADIKNFSEEWKEKIPPIFRNVAISINGKNSDGSSYQSYPFLYQLFDTTPVRVAIKERYLSEYIQKEIESIFKKG